MVDALIFFVRALVAAFLIVFGISAALAGSGKKRRHSTTDEIRDDMRRRAVMPSDGRAEIDIHLYEQRRN